MSQIAKYMATREESWKLLVQGLREQDAGKFKRASELWTEAEALVNELSAKPTE
jgi:hypothetical protein